MSFPQNMLPAINVRNETRIFIAHSPWDSLNKTFMPIIRPLNPVDAIRIKPTRFFYAWENNSSIFGNYYSKDCVLIIVKNCSWN